MGIVGLSDEKLLSLPILLRFHICEWIPKVVFCSITGPKSGYQHNHYRQINCGLCPPCLFCPVFTQTVAGSHFNIKAGETRLPKWSPVEWGLYKHDSKLTTGCLSFTHYFYSQQVLIPVSCFWTPASGIYAWTCPERTWSKIEMVPNVVWFMISHLNFGRL